MRTCVAILAAAMLAQTALAHHPDQTVQETFVYVSRGRLIIEYRTTLGGVAARAKLMAADNDSDGRLSLDEREAFLADFAREVLGRFSAVLDDETVLLTYERGTLSESSLAARSARATMTLRFKADISVLEGARRRLILKDANFPGQALGHMHYYVHAGPSTYRLVLTDGGRGLEWGFVQSSHDGAEAGHAVAAMDDYGEEEKGGLAGLIARENPSLGFMILAVAVAALLGAAHALGPGHGKAMVAAYMVGSKGRVIDAVILGSAVTFTHVFGMIVLGVVALWTTSNFAPQSIYGWLSVISGSIVFFIGFWMLARRALGHAHDHDHTHGRDHDHDHTHGRDHDHDHTHGRDHDHDHDPGHAHDHGHSHGHEHGHSHAPERSGVWGLLSLGFAGGLVPCPTTLVVLLTAVALQRIAFGVAIMAAYSIGLASTLIAFGIAAVAAGRYLLSDGEGVSPYQRYIPVVSSLVIMLAGIGIAVSALRPGGLFGLLH